MSSVLNSSALVLNKNWTAIGIETAREALVKTFTGAARIIDEDYNTYNWDEWIKKYTDPRQHQDAEFVNASYRMIRIPVIIVLNTYNRMPRAEVKQTRRNLLIRDHFKCSYCHKKVSLSTATVDHVIPKSKSGPTAWSNLVICCSSCNTKKGNRTLQEAGMKLNFVPKKPSFSPIYTKFVSKPHKAWAKFIDMATWGENEFWNEEIRDD